MIHSPHEPKRAEEMGVYKSELGRSAVIESRMSTAKAVDKGRALETQSGTLAGAHGGDGDTCTKQWQREGRQPFLFCLWTHPSRRAQRSTAEISPRRVSLLCTLWPCEEAGMRSQTRWRWSWGASLGPETRVTWGFDVQSICQAPAQVPFHMKPTRGTVNGPLPAGNIASKGRPGEGSYRWNALDQFITLGNAHTLVHLLWEKEPAQFNETQMCVCVHVCCYYIRGILIGFSIVYLI